MFNYDSTASPPVEQTVTKIEKIEETESASGDENMVDHMNERLFLKDDVSALWRHYRCGGQ